MKLKLSLLFYLLMAGSLTSMAQTYCVPTTVYQAGYGIGITNVTMAGLNNSTATPSALPTYFDYTGLATNASATPGSTVSVSVTLGTGNSTVVALYIDWNKDGTFNTTYGSEQMYYNTVYTASSVQTGSFVVPSVAPGVYRMRWSSEFGGFGTPPGPCATNYGEQEDYLFVVRAATGTDALAYQITSPANNAFVTGNNTVAMRWFNVGSTAITAATLGYQFNNGTPVTQAFSGSIAAGQGTTTTFTTQLNIGGTGTYPFKAYTASPNSVNPDAIQSNDTLYQTINICSPMNGVYTINPSGSGSTNFTTFSAAIAALSCNAGINGPVTFNVAAGTYVEQVVIPPIVGASGTNTITFNGGTGNAATRILSYNFPGSPTNYGVLTLNGADYVRFKNMTITSTSANYGFGVTFTNAADNNIIDSCVIDLGAVTNTSSANSAGINFSGAMNSTSTSGNNGNYNLVQNTTIKGSASGGPYRGINLYGSTGGFGSNLNNQFVNNTITDFFESGVYAQYYTTNLNVTRNSISRPNRTSGTTFYGVAVQYYNQGCVIDGNKIFNPNGGMNTTTNNVYGVYTYFNYYAGNYIRNNAIYNINGMGTNYGIYDYFCYNSPLSTSIYNNTVSMDNATAKTNTNPDYGIYVYLAVNSSSYVQDIRNNIVTMTNSGSSTGAYRYGIFLADQHFLVSDYNLVYVNAATATNVPFYQNGASYSTLGAWQASNSNQFDQNSLAKDPMYVNALTNVTPGNCAINNKGTAISTNLFDITGASRGTVPDLGAYEFNFSAANDAGVSALVNPGIVLCSGSQSVTVKIKNFGTATLTSTTVNWIVNGSPQTAYSWTGSLAPNAEATVTIGTFSFPTTASSFTAYTTSPNGSADGCSGNDTMSFSNMLPGMSGTYTIDPVGSGSSNFTTFAAAVTALNQRGVCGAVNFDVAAATYQEQIIMAPVKGASSVNTITFNGGTGNAATRILMFPTSYNGYGHIDLNGADYITFKNLTLKSYVGQTSGYFGVLLRNRADNNVIDSNIIDMSGLTTATSSNVGVAMTGSNTNYSTSGDHGLNNIIRGNQIIGSAAGGAYFGISVYPSSSNVTGCAGTKIIGNTIKDFYLYGIYLYYAQSITVKGNDISKPLRTAVTTFYGVYGYYDDYCVYDGNKIHDPFGGAPTTTSTFYGFYLYNNSGGSGPVVASNNIIYNMISNGALYGFYVQYEQNMKFIHNTISMDHTGSTSTSTSYGIYFYYANFSATPCTVKNNIISITRGGTGTKYALWLQYYYFISDNNDIYLNSTNAQMGYYYGYLPPAFTTLTSTTAATLATWKSTLTGMDPNSIGANPTFASASDYTPTNVSLNNTGGAGTGIIYDINGNPRHPSTPDAGAIEWGPACSGSPTVYGVTVDNLGSAVCVGSPVNLVAGYDPVSGITFQWQSSTNGTSFSNISGATSFQYSTTAANPSLYYRCAITCTASSQTSNTSATQINLGLSGVYTINPTGAGSTNFTSFTSAIAALNASGVCGPVTFNVAAGTYNGRISFSPVLGASATNTITFDGGSGNADNVIISESFATTTSYAIVDLNGIDWLRFRNITAKTTNASYGWGFLFRNAADNNIVENCVVDLGAGTAASTALIGMVLSASPTSYSYQGNHANNLLVQNNIIKGSASGGSYFGVAMYASTSNFTDNSNIRFINNTIQDFYLYGMYLYYYAPGMIVKGNIISRPNRSSVSTFYGIYHYYGYNHKIDGNIITNPFGGAGITNTNTFYGIYDQTDPSSGGPNQITNNQIYGAYCNGTMYGIYNSSAYYTSISHNTIVFDQTPTNTTSTSTIYGVYSSGSTSSSYPLDFKNNIIHITRPGGTRYGLYLASNPYYIGSNYNNIYVNGTGSTNYTGYRGGTNYGTLAAWQATGFDGSSVSMDAQFASATDYTPTNPALNNLGTGSANLFIAQTLDKNGKTRKATAPDMGSIEWTPICAGSDVVTGTPFQGSFRGGSLADFDHVKAKDTLTYSIVPPTGYTNAGYGTTWNIAGFSFTQTSLAAPGATDTSTQMPGASNGYIRFNPSAAKTDSMFLMTFNIQSLTASECVSSFSRYIFVAPVPKSDFDTTAVSCFGNALTISNMSTITTGAMSYEWNFGDTVDNVSVQGNPTHTFSHPGDFTVTLKTTSNLGYVNTQTRTIRVSYLPVVNYTFNPVCDKQTVNFSNTTSIPGPAVTMTYSWDFADGSALSTATNPSKLYSSVGSYLVKLTATSQYGCAASITKNVTVFPNPVAGFSVSNACYGQNTLFTNQSTISSGNMGYQWTFGDGTNSTDPNPNKTYTSANTYAVKLMTYSAFGCKDSITKNVVVSVKPTASFTASSANCAGDSVSFTDNSNANGGPSLSYTWTYGDAGTGTAAGNNKHQYTAAGNYNVNLTIYNGSCTDSKQVTVAVGAVPVASFTTGNAVCLGTETDFDNTSTGTTGTPTFDWAFGSTGTSTDEDAHYTFPAAGTFNVSLKVTSGNGCFNTVTMPVTVNSLPNPAWSYTKTSLVNQRQVMFTPGSSSFEFYHWDFGDGNTSAQSNPVYSYLSNGPFNAKLTVTDVNGCVNTSTTQAISFNVSNGRIAGENFSFDVYPNPFRDRTTVAYDLAKGGQVEVKVFDMTGKELATLVNTRQEKGSYEVELNAEKLQVRAGTYFVRLSLDGSIRSKQVLEVK